MKRQLFNQLIQSADFSRMFISEMGWNNPVSPVMLPPIEVDGVVYQSKVVAEKSGYRVLVCDVERIPTTSICRRIDIKTRNYANDYILIFKERDAFHHLWLAPVRKVDKRDVVTIDYSSLDQAEFLHQKIDSLAFPFEEVTTIVDVRQRVQQSFAVNSEKITKDFYAGFKKEHKAFVEFIKGISGIDDVKCQRDREWFASIMLNRLMFCYFIQKKGFLDGNVNYLRVKLNKVKLEEGSNKFYRSFYLDFLHNLFHDGLNAPVHSEEFKQRYGRIPYLNGGMFDDHEIERQYAGLDIADEAFERLFRFFDRWNWHLDTRITASGKDINPDVLGYIFEQYINDRAQMGAYYTKEDITEYIGRNCILPYLYDQVKNATKESARDFEPDGFIWKSLRESGDKYIFDAVKKGMQYLGEIPQDIRQGIITDDMRREYSETPVGELPSTHIPLAELRKEWNNRTPEKWGLPTEIWRETITRLQRCEDLIGKIASGEIQSINDFITYNLDIRSFTQDLLVRADSKFIRNFYHALQRVTILDPTCGSGAFLFAALNILEPLYEICIDRMQEFNRENQYLFKDELAEINDKYRSNIQYFIYKSIILRNLYGVDIMVEATEIAKLRLFLKMVAVVDVDNRAENLGLDPLPDIDFNIRCGNTLVGYANESELNRDLGTATDILQELANQEFKSEIESQMQLVAAAYKLFTELQLRQDEDMTSFKQAKGELRERLAALNEVLNHRLFSATHSITNLNDTDRDIFLSAEYQEWLKSHQPFHWLAEFYHIIQGNGGFDVIIGNPPYVGYTRKNKETRKAVIEIYQVRQEYKTLPTSNLYAFTIERANIILNGDGKIGMIIPISAFANDSMSTLQKFFKENFGELWISTFHQRPAQLFEGVLQRLSIFITTKAESNLCHTTGIYRWQSLTRSQLFQNLSYINSDQNGQQHFIKIGEVIERNIFNRYVKHKVCGDYRNQFSNNNRTYYRTAGGGYWVTFLNDEFDCDAISNKSTSIQDCYDAKVLTAAFNSNLFWWYYSINYDLFNFKDYMIFGFQMDYPKVDLEREIISLSNELENQLRSNAVFYDINSKTRGVNRTVTYQKASSKDIMDHIDAVLARHYGFSEEELDFIINYDIKYRMGDELNIDE